MRKKMYIEDLETKVKSLASHNDILLQENNALKEEITYLTKFINKTPGLAEEIAHSRPKGTVPPIRNVKAAGVCLLIVLFSFGLYFNNVQQFGNNGPALPFEGGAREPIPEVLPFGGERRYRLPASFLLLSFFSSPTCFFLSLLYAYIIDVLVFYVCRHGRMLKSFKDAVPSLVSETEEVGDLTPVRHLLGFRCVCLLDLSPQSRLFNIRSIPRGASLLWTWMALWSQSSRGTRRSVPACLLIRRSSSRKTRWTWSTLPVRRSWKKEAS
jgi:hypothetical protein